MMQKVIFPSHCQTNWLSEAYHQHYCCCHHPHYHHHHHCRRHHHHQNIHIEANCYFSLCLNRVTLKLCLHNRCDGFFPYVNRYKRMLQRPNIIEICSSCTQLPWRCKLYKYRGIFLLYMSQWVFREWCFL